MRNSKWKKENKSIRSNSKVYKKALVAAEIKDGSVQDYRKRLAKMYLSPRYKEHNIYPSTDTTHVYAVIAMCLELKKFGLSDSEIIDAINRGFVKRRAFFKALIYLVDLFPNSFEIAKKWNIQDHEKRVCDGSITYDYFNVSDNKVEYSVSKCMYVEMFQSYGIRGLCKIFCMTDETAYAGLTRHVQFIRHSDLSDGEPCTDEVMRKKRSFKTKEWR